MANLDKTIKLRAYTPEAPTAVDTGSSADDNKLSQELARKTAQLEEEKSKTQDNLKVIGQLRESLKQEQARSAELAKRMDELDAMRQGTLDSSKRSGELEAKLAEQQTVIAEQRNKFAEQQARIISLEEKFLVQETKAKSLQVTLDQIATLVASTK